MNGPMATSAHEDEVAEARFAAPGRGTPSPGFAGYSPDSAVPTPQGTPSPGFAGYSPDSADRLCGGPPPPASPGTPPTPRTDSAGDPLPRLRRVLPRLRGGERGVAGNTARHLTRDRLAALQLGGRRSRLRAQRGHLRHQHQVRPLTAALR